MAGIKYTGICSICGGCFRKSETKDHLERCLEEDRKKQLANGAKISTLFRILVKSEHKEYWLNLEASSDATLSDLDLLLRKVWLECCSHESYFTIKRTIYTSSADALFIHEGLAVRLGEVLQPGLIFEYVYGSLWGGLKSTELQLKVLSMRVGPAGAGPNGFIRVLARNVPPNLRCFCGEPAITVCTACSDLHMRYLCDDCARFHDCGREYQLPVVNSPRFGICKYMGDSEDAAEFRSYLEKSEEQEKNLIDDFLQSRGRSPVLRKSILEEKAPKNSG